MVELHKKILDFWRFFVKPEILRNPKSEIEIQSKNVMFLYRKSCNRQSKIKNYSKISKKWKKNIELENYTNKIEKIP